MNAVVMIAAPWLLVALAVLGGSVVAARRRALMLRMSGALSALREGAFQRVELGRGGGMTRALAQTYNLAIDELQQRLAAQACLAEIDRLLLEAEELEHVLEPILKRIRPLTGAQAAAMVLVDQD